MKLRTIRETIILLREEDPNTSINENYLRKLIKQDQIPHYNSGRRLFVNLDDLYAYFSGAEAHE